MGHNDHIDFALDEALQDLIDGQYFDEDSDEYQISRLIIDEGKATLSSDQMEIFNTSISDALKQLSDDNRTNEIFNSNPD